ALLFSWFTLTRVVDVFQRVRQGERALDPAIDVVTSLDLTRDQIQARIPYNLRTLTRLLQTSAQAFRVFLRTRSTTGRFRLRRNMIRLLRKAITLVEEISPRTELLDGLAEELFRFVEGLGELEREIAGCGRSAVGRARQTRLVKELRDKVLEARATREDLAW